METSRPPHGPWQVQALQGRWLTCLLKIFTNSWNHKAEFRFLAIKPCDVSDGERLTICLATNIQIGQSECYWLCGSVFMSPIFAIHQPHHVILMSSYFYTMVIPVSGCKLFRGKICFHTLH